MKSLKNAYNSIEINNYTALFNQSFPYKIFLISTFELENHSYLQFPNKMFYIFLHIFSMNSFSVMKRVQNGE